MWGSTLAGLAKKAQEEAQQRLAQIQSPSGLFNLDSLNKERDELQENSEKSENRSSSFIADASYSFFGTTENKTKTNQTKDFHESTTKLPFQEAVSKSVNFPSSSKENESQTVDNRANFASQDNHSSKEVHDEWDFDVDLEANDSSVELGEEEHFFAVKVLEDDGEDNRNSHFFLEKANEHVIAGEDVTETKKGNVSEHSTLSIANNKKDILHEHEGNPVLEDNTFGESLGGVKIVNPKVMESLDGSMNEKMLEGVVNMSSIASNATPAISPVLVGTNDSLNIDAQAIEEPGDTHDITPTVQTMFAKAEQLFLSETSQMEPFPADCVAEDGYSLSTNEDDSSIKQDVANLEFVSDAIRGEVRNAMLFPATLHKEEGADCDDSPLGDVKYAIKLETSEVNYDISEDTLSADKLDSSSLATETAEANAEQKISSDFMFDPPAKAADYRDHAANINELNAVEFPVFEEEKECTTRAKQVSHDSCSDSDRSNINSVHQQDVGQIPGNVEAGAHFQRSSESNMFTTENGVDTVRIHTATKIPSDIGILSKVEELCVEPPVDSAADVVEEIGDTQALTVKGLNSALESEVADSAVPNVPHYAIEKFMSQLQRLHTQHEIELEEVERRHQEEMEAACKMQQKTAVMRHSSSNEVVSHDKCLAQQRKLEKEYNSHIAEKENELLKFSNENERLGLRIDAVTREKDSLVATISERDKEIANMKDLVSKNSEVIEEKTKALKEELDEKEKEISNLKGELTQSKADVESLNEALFSLKSRVKVVATELKDRRVECRSLTLENQELKEKLSTSNTKINGLETQLAICKKKQAESDNQIEKLKSTVAQQETEITTIQKTLQEREAFSSSSLATYKKKAQASLATANGRAAAANQAREEAEADAASAKDSAANAMERVRVAEEAMNSAVDKANAKVVEIQNKIDSERKELLAAREEVQKLLTQCMLDQQRVEESRSAQNTLTVKLNKIERDLREERKMNATLLKDKQFEQTKCKHMLDDIDALKEELRQISSNVSVTGQKNGHGDLSNKGLGLINGDWTDRKTRSAARASAEASELEGNILMLQQDGAKETIKELKLSLRNALIQEQPHMHTATESVAGNSIDLDIARDSENSSHAEFNDETDSYSQNNSFSRALILGEKKKSDVTDTERNDSTPLYFALEKEAELNTARDEINRLATMLGNAEFSKMEAFESMEEMRKKMEEAEARLRRYEKLGSGGTRSRATVSLQGTGTSAIHGNNSLSSKVLNTSSPSQLESGEADPFMLSNNSTVNLEYLKNVMLSYLNAKTLNEKKSLVPVVGAVLELTSDEQATALRNVEESAGLQGVSASFIETLKSRNGRIW